MISWPSFCTKQDCLEKFSCFLPLPKAEVFLSFLALVYLASFLSVVWTSEWFKQKGKDYNCILILCVFLSGHVLVLSTLSAYVYDQSTNHLLMHRNSDLIIFICYLSDFQKILMKKCIGEHKNGYKLPNYVNKYLWNKFALI